MFNINFFRLFTKTTILLSNGVDVSEKYKTADSLLAVNIDKPFFFKVPDSFKESYETLSYFGISDGEYLMQSSVDVCNLELTEEAVEDILQLIENQYNVTLGVLSPKKKEEFLQKQKNRKAPTSIDCGMVTTLSTEKVRPYFNILAALSYREYPELLSDFIAAFNKNYDTFNIDGLSDYKIIDNRLYIPIEGFDRSLLNNEQLACSEILPKAKYFVISKNLYDYFYCSWGSNIQSCFSLNSSYGGWYGMLPFGMVDSHFICYVTTGESVGASMISGKKFPAPQMYWRAWGWLEKDTNKLLIDRSFCKDETSHMEFRTSFEEKFLKTFDSFVIDSNSHKVKNASKFSKIFSKYSLHFYPDSIRSMRTFEFCRRAGICSFRGDHSFQYKSNSTLLGALQTITNLPESFDPMLPFDIIKGELFNLKICPKTGLVIPFEDEESYYAKYFNTPVKNSCVISWIDGAVNLIDCSINYCAPGGREYCFNKDEPGSSRAGAFQFFNRMSNDICNLENLKQFLKREVDNTPYSVILLRIVEKDTCRVIKFKQKGVF